jgi:ubiquinone/menaquinone biosynthesis C-methylase UbiE
MSGRDFDDLVDFFDAMAKTSWLSSIHDQLKDLSGSWHEKNILDIGCGTGRLLERGLGEADFLIGIDLSEEMVLKSRTLLERQNTLTKSKLIVGDAYFLPIEDNFVDVALSTCVMFLLPEPEKGLIEMLRVVKQDGMMAMLNPSPQMNPETAKKYADLHEITGFERESLLMWSNVSIKRHRYSNADLDQLLMKLKVKKIDHTSVLDGLATITVAVK